MTSHDYKITRICTLFTTKSVPMTMWGLSHLSKVSFEFELVRVSLFWEAWSARLHQLTQDQKFQNIKWIPTPWPGRPCQVSSAPSWQRSTSLQCWLNSFSSSFLTLRLPWRLCSSSNSSCWHGDSSSSGSTQQKRWGAPAGEELGGPPGRQCWRPPGRACL